MLKKLLLTFALGYSAIFFGQDCPDLIFPSNGALNVEVNPTITWEAVDGVIGYRIRLGTSPGGFELVEQSVGTSTSYTPPTGLPESTLIYVTVILNFSFGAGGDVICSSQTFTTENVTSAPSCTNIQNPLDGATEISIFTNISWFYSPTATGYLVRIGTSPNGQEILPETDVGNVLSFDPPGQLPENDTIYVTVTPYNENGQATTCNIVSFTTRDLAPLPGCTNLTSPLNGAINVPLTPLLEWTEVPDATGYRVTIGSGPGLANVLDGGVFFSNSTFVLDFEPNRTFFITIIPFNDAGDAIGCVEENFSTLLGCGPYLDLGIGEFVSFNPDINFQNSFSFCKNEMPVILNSMDPADGYRWFQIDELGNESIISDTDEVLISESGNYRYEAYNIVSQSGNSLECPTTQNFEVFVSEAATIRELAVASDGQNLQITVVASGNGNYEYAIGNIDGPYQDSNVFNGVVPGTHIFYVRDKNGCGVAQESLVQDLTLEGFPKFFSPNGDNINDFWQFIQPPNAEAIVLQTIRIFDRYGKFLKEISQESPGWDGNFSGRPLPAGEYWFYAIDDTNRKIQGHFSLVR